jgi:adenosylmethionine-8-amino-7-oxononanoate aminotransferase
MPLKSLKAGMHCDLSASDRKHIWHPFTSLKDPLLPLLITSAEGVYLNTPDGRKIIDAISSWWVNLHGHGHTYIAEAIYRQALTLEHVIFAGFTHEPAIRLAERLLQLLPGPMERVFFSDNGSTAVEVAIKMALQFWYNQGIEKRKIIALSGAYHGDTFGAMSVGQRNDFTKPFFPWLFEVKFIDFPDEYHELSALARLEEEASSGQVAAFIYEPLLQGSAGMRTYAPAVLEKLLKTAKQYDILCIADEVLTGFGRTGKLFASEYSALLPDIITLSKGITGGTLPLGVTACNRKIETAFNQSGRDKTFYHGHSFTGNPLSCAAANASLDLLLAEDCRNSIRRIEASHRMFAATMKDHPAIAKIHHLGTLLSLELKTSSETSYFNEARNSIYEFFLEKDILLRPLGNVIYLLPPYIISNDELNTIYHCISDFLENRKTSF